MNPMTPEPTSPPPAPDLTEWDAKMRLRRLTNERPKTLMGRWVNGMFVTLANWEAAIDFPVERWFGTRPWQPDEYLDDTRPWREAAEAVNATPATLAEILRKALRFWESNGSKNDAGVVLTMEAVASHPNTPPEVLWDLPSVCARAFCANPVAPLILLERPDFVQHLSGEMGIALVREETVPRAILAAIASGQTGKGWWLSWQGRYVREASLHIALAGEIQTQKEWEADFSTYLKRYCQQFVPPSERDKERDERIAQWHCDLAELGLAPQWMRDPSLWIEPAPEELSPNAKEWLRFDAAPDSPEERDLWARIAPLSKDAPSLAKHLRHNATPADLITLVKDERVWTGSVLLLCAVHPNADKTVLQAMEKISPDKSLCGYLAISPHASAAFLGKLARHEDPLVRRLARRHKNAPPNARDVSRRAVVKHIRTQYEKQDGNLPWLVNFSGSLCGVFDQDEVALRGQDDAFALRLSSALVLSTEPNRLNRDPARRTTRDLLEHLARDGNRLVRWAAQKRLSDPAWTFTWETDV